MVTNSIKYNITTTHKNYRVTMRLVIYNLGPDDIGTYDCVAQNSVGTVSSKVTINCEYFLTLIYTVCLLLSTKDSYFN